jgi:hypothetical protein
VQSYRETVVVGLDSLKNSCNAPATVGAAVVTPRHGVSEICLSGR